MLSPNTNLTILLARLDGSQVGFPAAAVGEIVRAVAIAPLAGAPALFEGTVNLRGQVVPVLDLRHRLGLPAQALAPEQFLVALTVGARVIMVRVDDVEDVVDVEAAQMTSASTLSPALQAVAGIAATADGLIVLHDVDSFLTQAEDEALERLCPAGPAMVVS